MTDEDTIKNLKKLKSFHNGSYGTAIDLAIKALEQQSCEDTISRTALLSRIDAERKHLLDIKMDGAEHIIVHHARRIIEDMPSVTPKARLIPCSERMPEREGWYLTSLGDKIYGGADVDMYCKGWVKYGTHVLAWMPLPQPYTESEDKK